MAAADLIPRVAQDGQTLMVNYDPYWDCLTFTPQKAAEAEKTGTAAAG